MKKLIIFGLLMIIALLVMTSSAYAISQTDAEQIALKYRYDDENLKVYGPYTYELSSYYMADFYPINDDGLTNGVLIINAETGEFLKDRETAKKIALTHFIVENNDVYIDNHAGLAEVYSREEKIQRESTKTIENASELMKNQSFGTMIEAVKKTADAYASLNETITKIDALENKIKNGNKSYENALEIRRLNDEYISLLEGLVEMDDEYKAHLIRYYDELGHTPGYNSDRYSWDNSKESHLKSHDAVINDRRNELELEKENKDICDSYISFAVDPENQRISDEQVPGFGILLAVCAILIGGVLIQKRRK